MFMRSREMVIIVIEMVWGFGIETGNRIRIFNVIGDGNGDRDLPSSFFSGSGETNSQTNSP